MKALLLFPPNWAAAVAAPHLALPLMAGTARDIGWQAETWDLSSLFYNRVASQPPRDAIRVAATSRNWADLDRLYFNWEDSLRACDSSSTYGPAAGLLSGFRFDDLRSLPLADAASLTNGSSPYTRFLTNTIVPRLAEEEPDVIGITVASEFQLLPTIELLTLIREVLPSTFVVLGGNVITRLRNERSLATLSALADHTIIFQGEAPWRIVLQEVATKGVLHARSVLPKLASGDGFPTEWPVPSFAGIEFSNFPGVPCVPLVSTRGCYWGKCSFCAIPAGWSPTGYAGSLNASDVLCHMAAVAAETGIPRFKFVDEALAPAKARAMAAAALAPPDFVPEWEAYARLERAWDESTLRAAARAGLRKLYFGLEQVPTPTRDVFGKGDHARPDEMLRLCRENQIAVHFFCMVGHPRTTRDDAWRTIDFLITHAADIETADLVGFRLDRGTVVSGVRPREAPLSDWQLSLSFEPTGDGILDEIEVAELEEACQEVLWDSAPHLLHPLYRLLGNWVSVDQPTLGLSSPAHFPSPLPRSAVSHLPQVSTSIPPSGDSACAE